MQATDTHEHYRQAESCRFGSASVSEDNHLLLQFCNLHWVKRKLLSGSEQRKHDVVQRSVASCLLAPHGNVTTWVSRVASVQKATYLIDLLVQLYCHVDQSPCMEVPCFLELCCLKSVTRLQITQR